MSFQTEVMKVDKDKLKAEDIDELMKETAVIKGAELLKQGEVVAFPTETVYGLGADALNTGAVKKIFTAKGRPQDNPLIIHIADRDQLALLIDGKISNNVARLIDRFWPGPLTVVVPKNKEIPNITTAGLKTVAVRMPSHPIALALLKLSSLPLAAPSANSSGYPSPTLAEHVYFDLKGAIPLIIDGGQCSVGVESTVIIEQDKGIKILRPGGISREELSEVSDCSVQFVNDKYDDTPPSPGMKYRHYAPRTPLIIVSREKIAKVNHLCRKYQKPVFLLTAETIKDGLIPNEKDVIEIGSRQDLELIAYKLFALLRELDRSNYDLIIVEELPEKGMGMTLMNRLHKASRKDIYI